jgi:hypothetical protein
MYLQLFIILPQLRKILGELFNPLPAGLLAVKTPTVPGQHISLVLLDMANLLSHSDLKSVGGIPEGNADLENLALCPTSNDLSSKLKIRLQP